MSLRRSAVKCHTAVHKKRLSKKLIIVDSDIEPKKQRVTVEDADAENAERACQGVAVEEPEDSEAKLACLQETFFSTEVDTGLDEDGCCFHESRCTMKSCKSIKGCMVRQYLDTSDACSTSNLRKHAKRCWDEEAVERADGADNADKVQRMIMKSIQRDGTITAHFAQKKGTVIYSHWPHTKLETCVEFICWVSKNLRPFEQVHDHAFQSLMKTEHLGYYIPLLTMISHDIKNVFVGVRTKMSRMLKEYEGKISFATNGWTSPNDHTFIVITAHLEHKGQLLCFLLNIIEVMQVHTTAGDCVDLLTMVSRGSRTDLHSSVNLAAAFTQVLQEFGIEHKEQADYECEICPMKMVLVKIRKIAFKIIYSTTKLLPAWRDILMELKLWEKLLPQDVKPSEKSLWQGLSISAAICGCIPWQKFAEIWLPGR
ncbi:hypothetical protein L226DRAFT_570690 [Lentinus tigrinus ALCF2SS1-7]|uniref:DUF659 domain-containing protein n=1 Tax=Lentinus tigrinus ALCF2SS1-6 TaxID=1328759 RepID=A0A5C2SHU0_9APHY|nr:hypothetical protein L227DRAFT_610535 [Lentinus tigrinus ALCF2SS1-6]RPD75019.1 hypothetical protein L226DRAFT_570690 [Lentinus tigrinus ALCF2SS1-7]